MEDTMKFIDLTGMRFGCLKVLDLFLKHKRNGSKWLCECDCGRYGSFWGTQLKSKGIKSCGCYKKVITKERNTKHNMTNMPEYSVWKDIKKRCYDENSTSYPNYGGRGIKMSKEWYLNFSIFYDNMGARPSSEHSIERIDNNGDYYKENCVWATRHEQSRNKRTNNLITFNNETKCVKDWAKELNCSYQAITKRLKSGKDFEWVYNHFKSIIN